MAQLLESSESSYFPAFKNLFHEISTAYEESQDISDYLTPLVEYFENIEASEFNKIRSIFEPMFHTICLVWAHSKFYCRPARIIILLQEVNNLIIKRGTAFLDPIDLFKYEAEESYEKIEICNNILVAYQNCYESHKAKLKDYFKNGLPAREWEFTPKLAFARFDRFVEKVLMLKV